MPPPPGGFILPSGVRDMAASSSTTFLTHHLTYLDSVLQMSIESCHSACVLESDGYRGANRCGARRLCAHIRRCNDMKKFYLKRYLFNVQFFYSNYYVSLSTKMKVATRELVYIPSGNGDFHIRVFQLFCIFESTLQI